MPENQDDEDARDDGDKRFNETLKRMLNTPPKREASAPAKQNESTSADPRQEPLPPSEK